MIRMTPRERLHACRVMAQCFGNSGLFVAAEFAGIEERRRDDELVIEIAARNDEALDRRRAVAQRDLHRAGEKISRFAEKRDRHGLGVVAAAALDVEQAGDDAVLLEMTVKHPREG